MVNFIICGFLPQDFLKRRKQAFKCGRRPSSSADSFLQGLAVLQAPVSGLPIARPRSSRTSSARPRAAGTSILQTRGPWLLPARHTPQPRCQHTLRCQGDAG